ncbi:tetratricopeptide repeat protein [Kribbella sp. NPDC003505]|uniref:tetratricopeptide repeat protein n=1 Tax=Kribbella sp. NPDC003505 TaxID=3154448 RepID=UPI0033B28E50
MEQSFAAALRAARVGRGLTQEGLAERAGLSAQAIGLLERGVRRFPQLTTLDKLHRALNLSEEEREHFRRLAARGAVSGPITPAPAQGPSWTVARQVPAGRQIFAGRRRELDHLIDVLTKSPERAGSPTTVTVRGMAGVGKTALAIEAAQACADRFPDGTLFVNLRGFGTPLSQLQAVGQLLRATGTPPDAVPGELTEAVATLRSRLSGRRVLVILDNARDVEQVTNLIPASAAAAVLITSRNTLTLLPADLHLQVDPLPASDSADLLARIAGPDRLAGATAQIAELCGHLPLALSIAAAWTSAHPDISEAELVHRLTDESRRLDLLHAGDRGVRASLSSSVDQLRDVDPAAADAFVLLGLSDAEDFTAETSAPLICGTPAEAGRLLERLADLHLVIPQVPGRYHVHDLVRAYVRELAEGLPPVVRDAALDRLLAVYSGVAWRTVFLNGPTAARLAWPHRPPVPAGLDFTATDVALGWIDSELHNYLALIEQFAALSGRDEHVGGLVIGLFDYFVKRGNLVDWLPSIERVVGGDITDWTRGQLQADAAIALAELARYDESAERFGVAHRSFEAAGSLRGMALAANNKARLLIRMHRHREALPLVESALAVNQQLGDVRGVAAAYLTRFEIQLELGDPWAAEADATAAMQRYLATGDADGVANARIESAWARTRSGRPELAVEDIQLSLAELEALGQHKGVSDAYQVLALTYKELHDYDRAIEQVESALEIAKTVGDSRREAQGRLTLGELLTDIREYDDALPNLQFALDFYREHHPGQAERAEQLLKSAQQPS